MSLKFVPHEGIFSDFLITTNDNASLRNKLCALGAKPLDKGSYTLYVWHENLDERFFVGLGVVDKELTFGPRRIKNWPQHLGAGSYALVDATGESAVVEADPFGMHVIYAGNGLVTNRLHLAAIAVGEVDVSAALTSTYNEGVFSFSFNTFATPVKGVEILGVGERVYVGSTLKVIRESSESDFQIRPPNEYWELIERGASDIIDNVEAIVDSGWPVMCDITGGRDSRIVFAALLAAGRIEDVTFNTNTRNPALSKDLQIGTGLVKIFSGRYSDGPAPSGYAQHTIEENLQRRRSQLFGSYHFITEGDIRPITVLTHGYTIRMLGGGGELYRDYYQDLFNTVPQERVSTTADIRAMFFKHHGTVYARKFLESYLHHFESTFRRLPGETIGHKLDAHYLNFRNRYHFGTRQSTPSSIYSINPATSKYLLRAARSLPFEDKASGRVLFDVIRALDEKLAYLPFDKPVNPRIFTSSYHRPSIFDGSQLHIEPAEHLATTAERRFNPLRPQLPKKPQFSFTEVLNAEIEQSIGLLEHSDSLFTEAIDSNLRHFITYAQEKSPRHHAATASRLRSFADLHTLSR
jgi:hypothetical protein